MIIKLRNKVYFIYYDICFFFRSQSFYLCCVATSVFYLWYLLLLLRSASKALLQLPSLTGVFYFRRKTVKNWLHWLIAVWCPSSWSVSLRQLSPYVMLVPSNVSYQELGPWSRPGVCLGVVWLDVEHNWQDCLWSSSQFVTISDKIRFSCFIRGNVFVFSQNMTKETSVIRYDLNWQCLFLAYTVQRFVCYLPLLRIVFSCFHWYPFSLSSLVY